MPADRAIAPLVASIALDYAEPPSTERTVAPMAPLVVSDTDGDDEVLDALLEPYVARGAVQREAIGGERRPARRRESSERRELDPSPGHRHRVTNDLVERWRISGAVYVSPGQDVDEEILRLEGRGIEVAVFALDDPLERERHASRDAVGRMMQDRRRRSLPREEPGRQPIPSAEPYAYVAQRVVARWSHGMS